MGHPIYASLRTLRGRFHQPLRLKLTGKETANGLISVWQVGLKSAPVVNLGHDLRGQE